MPRRQNISSSPTPTRQTRSAVASNGKTRGDSLLDDRHSHGGRETTHNETSPSTRISGRQKMNTTNRPGSAGSNNTTSVGDEDEEQEAESDDSDGEGDNDDDEPGISTPSRGSKSRNMNVRSLRSPGSSARQAGKIRAAGSKHVPSIETSQRGTKRSFSNSQRGGKSKPSQHSLEEPSKADAGGRKKRAKVAPIEELDDATSADEPDFDDDDYEGVDLISDSEADEPGVEKEEEQFIIKSAAALKEDSADETASMPSRKLSISSESEWGGFDLTDELFMGDVPFFDEQYNRTDHFAGDVDIFDGLVLDANSSDSTASRRVRFQEDSQSSDSSSTGSDDEDGPFPDLFIQQDQLDPALRLIVENGDGDNSSITDGEGSYWDFRGSDEFVLGEDSGSQNSDGESSGYETDEGDTTDEDLPPPATISRPRFLLRQPSSSSDETTKANPRLRRASSVRPGPRRIGPSMGSWVADPSKPIAVIDSTGKHMVIIPARRAVSRNGVDLFGLPGSSDSSVTGASPHTPHATLAYGSEDDLSDFSNQDITRAITNSGANLMLGGLLHGAPGSEHILGGQVLGPPEAFFPFTDVNLDGQVVEDEVDDEEDDENLWDVQDFINFGDGSSESENDDGDDTEVPDTPATSTVAHAGSTPMREDVTPVSGNTTQHMLNHFDRGIVTAFRRNQTRHKLLLSKIQHRESAPGPAGSTPYHRGPIKGGSMAAANTPITPLRKRRIAKNTSPLDNVAVKRRAMNATAAWKNKKSF